jgi:hypothetical protein
MKGVIMGALFFFDEEVTANDNKGKRFKCQVEVLDNHGIPEVRIGPVGEAYKGSIAEFDDWKKFIQFVDALNDLRDRLAPVNKTV